ncbi:unnamed protein product [Rotaria sp. Silwood2]|nr:unnamed protein product [Rotaria sp. Silwood2]CAF4295750.1 unnamed protein product [Rotaria sp. Silwood2]
MSLPNLSNTMYLRTLTINMNTSYFLKRLLSRIPFIENLSLGVNGEEVHESASFNTNAMPVTVDIRLVYLFRLLIDGANNTSFHRAIALFSSMFGQL